MSAKKPSLLKAKLQGLKVNEPLRLPRSGPCFKPPQREKPNSEVPRFEVPQEKPPQSEGFQIEVPQQKGPQLEPPPKSDRRKVELAETSYRDATHSEPPHDENIHFVAPQTDLPQFKVPLSDDAHFEQSQFEGFQEEIAHIEAPQLEFPHSEVPEFQKEGGAGGGFFMLSHRTFSNPTLQRLSGDCFRLFLWLSTRAWRFRKSNGTLRAAVSYIEQDTHMSHATISRGLRTLQDLDLVRLVETNYKKGNLWWVKPVAWGGAPPEHEFPHFDPPQKKGPQIQRAAPTKRENESLKSRKREPQFEGQIRSIKNLKNLSQEGALLVERLEKISAPRKRECEAAALEALLKIHAPSTVLDCVTILEKHGVLGTGEPCHSPFRYLLAAIDDVLRAAKGTCSTASVASVIPFKQDTTEISAEEARAEFDRSLSVEEQAAYLSEFLVREFTFGYTPPTGLAIRLAALDWFQNRTMSTAVM